MLIDHSNLKLGKRARRHDVRTLKLARYLAGPEQAPLQPPASIDYTRGITDWGMMVNDQLGCCTIAAVGHAVQTWTANSSRELTVPDSTILEYYEKWDGYNPANPSTDQGGVELDVLNDWRQGGFDGVSLDAYVAVELGTHDTRLGARELGNGNGESGAEKRESGVGSWDLGVGIQNSQTTAPNPPPSTPHPIAQAIWLFGGAYIGVELPISAQRQDVWDVPANPGPDDEPGSWGGHAVYLVGYDLRGMGGVTGETGLGRADSEFRKPNSGAINPDSEARARHFGEPTGNSGFRIPNSGTSNPNGGTQASNSDSRIADAAPVSRVPSSDSQDPFPVSRVPSSDSQDPSPVSRNQSRAPSTQHPTLTCITWGKPKKMTLAWFEKYCSEAYALVSKDWLKSSGIAPSGFDLAALESDLENVSGQ